MGDPYQNKNKRSKSKTSFFPLIDIIKHKGADLSRGI
jgi:leucyl-tRNA synthetase